MHRRAIFAIAGLAGLCALLVMISLYTLAEDPGEGTRSPATYVGKDICAGCHSSKETDWMTTAHGQDFTQYDYNGNITNKITLYGGSCAPCHVVGYNDTAQGGYDPAQAWNSSHNIKFIGIQCESCHGPGSDHVGAPSPSTINLDRDPYAQSCGGMGEAGCHGGARQFGNETVHGWNSSAHAPWDNIAQDNPGGLNNYCARCKSPSQWDPSVTSMGDSTPIPKNEWRGITCGDCHDPHEETANEHQLRYSEEEICGTCHTSEGGTSPGSPHHAQKELREAITGSELGAPFMSTVTCPDCHMWSTGHGVTPAWQGHSFEPKAEACESCHSLEGVEPELTVVEAQDHIDDWVTETETLLHEAEDAFEEASAFFTSVSENRTASAHTLMLAGHMLDNASFDIHLVESGYGVHNPYYAIELMESSIHNSETVMEMLEAPDVISGLTANGADNGMVDLSWSASSADDFSHYNVYASMSAITDVRGMAPVGTVFNKSITTHTVAGLEGGEMYYFAVTAVDLDGNEIPTGLQSASATPGEISGGDGAEAEIPIWIWAVIIVLVILMLIGFMMAMRGRGGEAMPEEPAPEPEAPTEETEE
jgi:predicted CXXCH cytochrome family protein